jgi:hypothetical protein
MGTSAWAWSFFSKVRSSRSIKLYKPENWLWQLVVIVFRNHYVAMGICQISHHLSFGSKCNLAHLQLLMLRSHFQFTPQWTLTLQNWYTHTPQQNYWILYQSRRWDINAEEIHQKWKKSHLSCFVVYLIFCFMYRLHIFTNNITTLYQNKFGVQKNFVEKVF